MRALVILMGVWIGGVPAFGMEWQEDAAMAGIFRKAGITGTFVVHEAGTNVFAGHDRARAEERFFPASTFKIPNSLIGLSVGAVKDVDEVLPYGGEPQPIQAWEKDMGLREAIRVSNVPVYQELARRIGLERMRVNVAKLGYGNAEIGGRVDQFWLEGPLRISAIEQAKFLERLAAEELPFSREHQTVVRSMVFLEKSGETELYGKTGWTTAGGSNIGWWVGWVKKGGAVHSFALNIEMKSIEVAPKRMEMGKACLESKGLWESKP